MRLLKDAQWEVFRTGDLFNIHPTKSYKLTNHYLLDGGKTPVVLNSGKNNGIGGYTSKAPTESGNIITFSDTTDADTIFYQPEAFVGYSHVQGMYPTGIHAERWNKFSLLFFVASFRKAAKQHNFDYQKKFRRDTASELMVSLPVEANGEPNWTFMTEYMKEKIELYQRKLLSLSLSELAGKPVKYEKFKVKELFEIVNGKGIVKKEVSQTGPGLPAVQSGAANFGIIGYLDLEYCKQKKYVYSLLPCLTVARSGSAGFVGIHEKCVVGDSAKLLKPKFGNASPDALLFVRASLMALSHKYDYQDKVTEDKYGNERIALPVADNGSPDWRLMREYMRSLVTGYQAKLESLNCFARRVA